MNLSELLDALNGTGTRLRVEEGKLVVDAPKGAMTPELRAGLAEHRETLLDVMAIPREIEATVATEDKRVRAIRLLLDWLWYLATEYVGGSVHGPHGKVWHVQATVSRLLFTDVNEEWLNEASYFYWSMIESRPDLPTVTDIEEWENARSLNDRDARELRSILGDFNEAMESSDQAQVDDVWTRLNDFNERTGRAKRSDPPRVTGRGERILSSPSSPEHVLPRAHEFAS